jgi:hypothetical protein
LEKLGAPNKKKQDPNEALKNTHQLMMKRAKVDLDRQLCRNYFPRLI